MRILGFILLAIALSVVGCMVAFPTYTYRYRLTLDVEMPDGSVRSGSNVVEVRQGQNPRAFAGLGMGGWGRVTGEGVVIDLGNDRLLVALLTNPGFFPVSQGSPAIAQRYPLWTNTVVDPTAILLHAYGLLPAGDIWDGGRSTPLSALSRQRGARPILPDQLPGLVTFDDPSDPRTIQRVDPNRLDVSFGPGVRLLRATIEVTDAPITRGTMERRFPWLHASQGSIDGSRITTTDRLSNLLVSSDFRREGI